MDTEDNKYELSGFTAIRNEVFQANLSPSEFKVLLFLHALDFWRHKDRSYSFIANGVGLHKRTVFRMVMSLEKKGFIKKIPGGRYNSNKYKLLRSFIYRDVSSKEKKSLHSNDKKPGNKTKNNETTEASFLPPGPGPGGGSDDGSFAALLATSREVRSE